jgi:hypothetical protein
MYVLRVETRTKILNTALPAGNKHTHKSDPTSKVLVMTPRYHFTPGFWLSIVERCWTSMIVTAFSVPLTDALSHWKPYHLHQWFQKQQNLIDWSFDILSVITFQLMMWYLNLEPSITFVNTTSLHHLSASYSYVVTKVLCICRKPTKMKTAERQGVWIQPAVITWTTVQCPYRKHWMQLSVVKSSLEGRLYVWEWKFCSSF